MPQYTHNRDSSHTLPARIVRKTATVPMIHIFDENSRDQLTEIMDRADQVIQNPRR